MPHDVRSPHIFQDGPGNTASGEQVMDNFDAVWTAHDVLITLARLAPLVLYGTVNGSSGAITAAGTGGWSSVKGGSGVFTITFSPAFSAVPFVTFGLNAPTAATITYDSLSASTMVVFTKDAVTGGVLDCNFAFHAIGPR